MKRKRTITMLLLTIIAIALGFIIAVRVSAKTECLVENNIYTTAKIEGDALIQNYSIFKAGLYLKKHEGENSYGVYDTQTDEIVYYSMNLSENHLHADEDGELPFVESEYEIPKHFEEMFEEAKILVKKYVADSAIIKEEHKEEICNVIDNVTNLHYGYVSDELESVPLFTSDFQIYVSDSLWDAQMISTHAFIHELIHVVSNVTNSGTKYESCYYNHNEASEVITELLTEEIIKCYGYVEEESMYEVSYTKCSGAVYALLNQIDVLKAYYYSDYFDAIMDDVNIDALNLFYLVLSDDRLERESRNNNAIIVSLYLK